MAGLTGVLVVVGAVALAVAPVRIAAQKPDVAASLAKAANYLASYEKGFSVVVSEEKYAQVLLTTVTPLNSAQPGSTSRQQRVLRSDVLQTSVGASDWVAFRDVFEVDGAAVRDRDTRLQTLFVETPAQALTQARRIVAESARYNIGTLQRNINVPTMVLTYLREGNQARSTFEIGGRQDVNGVSAVVLEFKERATPTIVRSADFDLPATGRFWMDPVSGRILKTEMSISGRTAASKITVTYGPVAKLPVWAPIMMKEEYTVRETIFADAVYSNFRQFSVSVTESGRGGALRRPTF